MNVSVTNVDSVNAIIQVSVEKSDYQENFDVALRNFRKKANMPGFRPGTVPVGMVNKMYGKSILAEEINKIVGESLYKYIQENKLNVLGEPLPNLEKQSNIDFSKHEDYDFYFDIALAPEIKLAVSKDDKIPYYKIIVDDELAEKQVQSYISGYGKYEKVEEGAIDTDLLRGVITELDNGQAKESGIVVNDGILMPSYLKDEEEKKKFIGVKPGDVITFNPGKAYDGADAEIASLLHIKKDEIDAISAEFSFTVNEVTRYKEAELDQSLFDRVFGTDVVKTEADFRLKVKEMIQQQLAPDCDYKFLLDAKKYLEDKVGVLQFPDAFLKRWLLTTGKEKTVESIEQDYPKIEEDLKFHLIKEQLVKDNDLKIDDQDVKGAAQRAAKAQFAQYGMMQVEDEMLDNYVAEMLKNKEASRNFVDAAMEAKVIDFLKNSMGLEEKEISMDDFRKFFENASAGESENA